MNPKAQQRLAPSPRGSPVHSPLFRALALLTLSLPAACRNDPPLDKPAAPNMQPLLDVYAAPTGALTADTVAALLLSLGDQVAAIDALQLDQRVIDAARAGLAQAQAAAGVPPMHAGAAGTGVAASAQALTVQGDGYLVVTRICDGFGPMPWPDPGNGYLQLTVGFTERGVDPVVWGNVVACNYVLGGRNLHVDGTEPDPRGSDVRVFLGRDVTFETFGTFPDPVVVDIAARVIVDGRELPGRLSFRIDVLTRALEVLLPLGTGHAVAALSPDRSAIALRAQNGTFTCDLALARCTAPTGETIGAP